MKLVLVRTMLCMFVVGILCNSLNAQSATSVSLAAVPRLVNFSGRATDGRGKVTVGVVGVTFSIYKDQYEGAPLWMETQNVHADRAGNYTAQLGATKSDGLPLEVFTTGGARWLGVRQNGGEEQRRVLLLSVPYALKAADAETVGGLPASAFVLAAPASGGVSAAPIDAASGASPAVVPPPATITGAGTTNFVPLFTGVATLGNSVLFQSGSGTTAKVGINTSTPGTTLDVKGAGTFRGALALPATAPATAASGKTSQPLNLVASTFNSLSGTAVNQAFRLQAEPVGNNTNATGATLNLLYASGSNAATETGLKITSNGRITFAAGQTFPGAGKVSSVGLSAPNSDFTVSGSPVTSAGILRLNWTVPPTSANIPNAIVKRDGAGGIRAGTVTASAMGLGTTSPTERLDLGNDGNVVISTDPGSDTTPDLVGYSLVGRGTGGASNKWSIYTAPVGGGFGVPANSFSIYQYPPNQDPGCCLQRFTILPSTPGQNVSTVYVDGEGHFGLGILPLQHSLFTVESLTPYGIEGGCEAFGCTSLSGFVGGESGVGVAGAAQGDGSVGIYGMGATSNTLAGYFDGNVTITGGLSKMSGSFKIDHPLDPPNKYLYHSFVESPDMKNVYDGTIGLDGSGEAWVELPDWFEALNRDFRYQLTPIGAPAVLYVAEEISGNRFKIGGGRPGGKASWQVTGIRHDAWANAHRIPVEEAKPERERGFYLRPELFGAPEEKSVGLALHPELVKEMKARKAKHAKPANHSANSRSTP